MNIDSLRQEQRALRSKGVYRGIGMAAFVEVTAPGGRVYGNIEVPLPVLDGISLYVDPSGSIRCAISVTDQGQGTHTAIAQVVAEAIGVPFSSVRVISGDSAATPHGSGASASRTTAIGGELALNAGRALKMQILDCAAPLLQTTSDQLSLENGKISRLGVGPQITLKDLSQIVHFKGHTLPAGGAPNFSVSLQFGHDWPAIVPTNGIQ